MGINQPKDGGSAYPIEGHFVDASGAMTGNYVSWPGMTLRDYFAAQAMNVICNLVPPSINPAIDGACEDEGILPEEISQETRAKIAFEMLSHRCYDFADAMLSAREQRTPGDTP